MFNGVYKSPCTKALQVVSQSNLIETEMGRLFPLTNHGSSATVHADNLRTIRWNELKSNETCFCCLRRKPEQVFTCGHAICDVCVEIFGNTVLEHEYCYMVICMLCQNGNLVAKLKPPTAGVRILSIDGGGIRGVIPLEFLSLLQDSVGSACPIQDLFDLAIGTSSGKKLRVLIYQAYHHPN